MITAVDLLRGLAKLIGWQRIDVPGATGYSTPTTPPRAATPSRPCKEHDLVCVHVEATDEASHEGDAAAKIEALEQIDRHIVGPRVRRPCRAIRSGGSWSRPIIPRRLRTKTHSHGDVPMAMAGSGIEPDGAHAYDDPTAARSSLVFPEGWRLMGYFLGK